MARFTWTRNRSYSVADDAEMVTYVGYSGHGTYWIRRPLAGRGRSRREQQEEMLDAIEDSIDAGDDPGEVTARLASERERV